MNNCPKILTKYFQKNTVDNTYLQQYIVYN